VTKQRGKKIPADSADAMLAALSPLPRVDRRAHSLTHAASGADAPAQRAAIERSLD
jgi:hypothetical protein